MGHSGPVTPPGHGSRDSGRGGSRANLLQTYTRYDSIGNSIKPVACDVILDRLCFGNRTWRFWA